VSGTYLFAGTYGSGVWRRPLSEMLGIKNPKSQGGLLNQVSFKVRSSNHTNSNVAINFYLSHSIQVAIKIYDLSGHEISTLINKNFGSGAHSISWNTRNIVTGCYTVKIKIGSNTYVGLAE
jgi:flagellar hook assembly protein FlgD